MTDHRELVARLRRPASAQGTCEGCFDQLDCSVEAALAGADADAAIPGMAAHLDGCPACREDYHSLYDLVVADASPALHLHRHA